MMNNIFKNKRKVIKNILLFVIIFSIVFCITFFATECYLDEIWSYGFSYNISCGLVPYRDFNMLLTPLLFYLGSLFINIFGHHLWSVNIFNSLIITIIICIMYKEIGNKVYILLPFMFPASFYSYNLFCLLLVIIILFLVDKKFKNKDILIALLVSFVFLSKQNIGACLFIPMLFYSRNKIKSFIVFMIPILMFVVYFMLTGAFYNFIDYCFLGMLDFGESNSNYSFLIFELLVLGVLIYILKKSKFKDEKAFYVLMFQIVAFPICDGYHFLLGSILFLYYIFLKNNLFKLKLKYCFTFFIVSLVLCIFFRNVFSNYYFYNDSNSYLYGRVFDRNNQLVINEVGNYILDNVDDYGDNIFIFSIRAYLIKLNINVKINKYDLINNGNMGYKGDERIIKEVSDICSDEKCLFIIDPSEFDINNQLNKNIINYVEKNYRRVGNLYSFVIYDND